jgi:hypothetical protein
VLSNYAIIRSTVADGHEFTGETFWTREYAEEVMTRLAMNGDKGRLVIITDLEVHH